MTREDFYRPVGAFAVRSGFCYRLCCLEIGEFARMVSASVDRVGDGIPRYYSRTPAASYFWPKKRKDVSIGWEWEFDEIKYRYYAVRERSKVYLDSFRYPK